MSWQSSALYYRLINEGVAERLGGLHSASIVMVSVDFAAIEGMQSRGDWEQAAAVLVKAGKQIQAGGAGCLAICTNTMHKVASEIEQAISIPLLHIGDATAQAVTGHGLRTVGLLGTRFTMEQRFYRDRLEAQGIEVLIPTSSDREVVNRVIYDELCLGLIEQSSRQRFRSIMHEMISRGAQGIIAGCTEIGMLIQNDDSPAPLFDTTRLHANACVDWALSEEDRK